MSTICAHRGGALLWPENSLTAFSQALQLPIEEVECDVHLSADGVAHVHHDATLERTTEGHGPIAHRTAAELAATRLRGLEEGVPTLAALLALVAVACTWWVAPLAGAGVVGAAAVGLLAYRKIGGISGDVLGACEQVVECLAVVVVSGLATHQSLADAVWFR